jgi:FkbM family methyltransferase
VVSRTVRERIAAAAPGLAARWRWERNKRSDLARRVVDELVQPGQTVVDVGASNGVFAERMARLVGPNGRVHAFEANPEDSDLLEQVRGRCPNVVVHMAGLSDQESVATLHVPVIEGRRRLGRASVVVPGSRSDVAHDEITIALQRLDDALGDERSTVAFVKCDVEGHEHAVLEGALDTLRRGQPALLVEIEQRHRDRDVRETFALLAQLGYEGFGIRGQSLVPLSAFDLERDQARFVDAIDSDPDDDAPPDYVHNFVFAPAGRSLPAGLTRRVNAQRS